MTHYAVDEGIAHIAKREPERDAHQPPPPVSPPGERPVGLPPGVYQFVTRCDIDFMRPAEGILTKRPPGVPMCRKCK